MTESDIYLSLPKEDQIPVMKFLNRNNLHKEMRYKGEYIEILVIVDENNSENDVQIAQEITSLIMM